MSAARGPAPEPLAGGVAVVLVVRDEARLALRTLLSLAAREERIDFHTVLIDDASLDATPVVVAGVQGDFTTLRRERPQGFAAGLDAAVTACEQELIVVLREDLLTTAGWLEHTVAPFCDPAVGAVRPRVVDLSGEQIADACWPCLAFRRAAFESVGGVSGAARNGRALRASFTDALTAAGWALADAPDALLLSVPLAASDAAGFFEVAPL